ncbi:hypothetical protein Acsp03_43570 [Actinomadura sp. NBRC 104412]|nr:hypothetical protein Acsp03_43570 [Actinomadura sp. NBRC 104412]
MRPIDPSNSRSPENITSGISPAGGSRNVTDPGVWPGAWSTVNDSPRQVQDGAVRQFLHVVGLAQLQPAEELLPGAERQALGRIGQQVAIVRVDVGGDVLGAADGRDGPDVIDMAVGQQHRHRPQPVLAQDLVDPGLGVLAGVDDDALLTRGGRHDIAVRGERSGGEPGDEHCRPSFRPRGTRRAPGGLWPSRRRRSSRAAAGATPGQPRGAFEGTGAALATANEIRRSPCRRRRARTARKRAVRRRSGDPLWASCRYYALHVPLI